MSASAGRVLLIPKGAYNASATYAPLDYVTYTDGNTYVCKAATTGHAPTDTTYWQILVDNSGVVHTVDIANNLTTQTAGKVLDASQGYALNNSLTQKAAKNDLTNISITGSTNNTGSTITAGTYFYLNGAYVKAKANIASGASFTLNTNYEVVTVGGVLSNLVSSKQDSLNLGITATNLDNCGDGCCITDSNTLNRPSNEARCVVFSIGTIIGGYSFKIQIAISHDTGKNYIRYAWGSWANWHEL